MFGWGDQNDPLSSVCSEWKPKQRNKYYHAVFRYAMSTSDEKPGCWTSNLKDFFDAEDNDDAGAVTGQASSRP